MEAHLCVVQAGDWLSVSYPSNHDRIDGEGVSATVTGTSLPTDSPILPNSTRKMSSKDLLLLFAKSLNSDRHINQPSYRTKLFQEVKNFIVCLDVTKGELLAEFANYFHYGYKECMKKNLVNYLTTEDRAETKDINPSPEPIFGSVGSMPEASDYLGQLLSSPEHQSHSPSDSVYQQSPPGHFSWYSSARSPAIKYPTVQLSAHTQQHGGYLSPV
ncbi:unnamed protein product [Pleuronectes platessa]|uniref:Uncharacterized protein n=1 Tax=Pleuronectes platessa TaxID=8262 RepID=A0A9N7TZH9_PLEPL|nr:unnamed protein product [Pleuronectes platessa]